MSEKCIFWYTFISNYVREIWWPAQVRPADLNWSASGRLPDNLGLRDIATLAMLKAVLSWAEFLRIHTDQRKFQSKQNCNCIWQQAKLLLTWIYWLSSDTVEHQLRRDSLFNRPYHGPLLPACQLVAKNESSDIWLVESPKGSEQSAIFPVWGGD